MTDTASAFDQLLALVDPDKAAEARTSPSTAIAEAIREAIVNAPSLRHCIYPGCLREFDMTARMNGREPARPSWSGDGWHQVTRGPSPGSLCPEHVDIVTTHLPRTVDLPNGRWMVACACDWMSRPQTYGGLLKPLWEEHILLTAGTLTAPVTLAETPGRLPLDQHTDDSLAELYDALEDTEHDRAETYDAAQAMYKSWDWHRRTLGGVSTALASLRNTMATDPRDWAAERRDAWLYGVLFGWPDDAMQEVASKHGWNEYRVKRVRELRGYLAPLTDPQPTEGTSA